MAFQMLKQFQESSYLSSIKKIFLFCRCVISLFHVNLSQEDTKGSSFMDTKKEELIKAIKQAMQHKEEARKKTAEEWKREGIKGKVILI